MFFNRNKTKEQDSFESYKDIKTKECKDLIKQYRLLTESLNFIDCRSERFDAICLELREINHRIAAVKKILIVLEGP